MPPSDMPLVSVVVPTYNRRHVIGETIASVLTQTHRHLELIVVDDGSTDSTKDFVLDSFGNDPRLRYVVQVNSERARARNRGISESRGDYLAFIDSDDVWMPAKLERQLEALRAHGSPECCYCLHDVLSSDQPELEDNLFPPDGDIFGPLLSNCFIGSMTPVIHRRCFDVVGGFCEDRRLLCFEDWEMWTRLATAFRWTLVPEVLGRQRLHDGNTQHAATLEVDELRMRLMRSYRLSGPQRTAVRNYMTARRWHWATAIYRTQPHLALKLLARLVRNEPRRLAQRSLWGLVVRSSFARETTAG